jgi:outer membrane protein
MKSRTQIGRIILWAVAVAGLVIGILNLLRPAGPRIAFVRTREMVYQYSGMQEAQNRYKSKQAGWEHEIDSLETEFRLRVDTLRISAALLRPEQLEARKRELALQRSSLDERRNDLESQASKEDMELTQGVLSQVNSFIEGYGKDHGYDIIVGTTTTGNVLYGADALDVTEDVLNQLNKRHVAKAN